MVVKKAFIPSLHSPLLPPTLKLQLSLHSSESPLHPDHLCRSLIFLWRNFSALGKFVPPLTLPDGLEYGTFHVHELSLSQPVSTSRTKEFVLSLARVQAVPGTEAVSVLAQGTVSHLAYFALQSFFPPLPPMNIALCSYYPKALGYVGSVCSSTTLQESFEYVLILSY